MIGDIIFWIGLVHLIAYCLFGLMLAVGAFIDWLAGRLRIQSDLINAYGRLLKDRRAAEDERQRRLAQSSTLGDKS